MSANKCLYIPREINEEYVFIWKRDEVIFLIFPLLFFFVIGGLIGLMLTLIGLIVVAITIKNLSIDRPSGYLLHWMKYNLPESWVKSIFTKTQNLDIAKSLILRDGAFPPAHLRYIAG